MTLNTHGVTSAAEVREVEARIAAARSPVELFGALPSGDVAARKAALQGRFRELALAVHPDRAAALDPDSRRAAEAAFWALVSQCKRAEALIERGGYGDDEAPEGILVESPQTAYLLEPAPFTWGDFSEVYRGRCRAGLGVIVKVAQSEVDNPWLEREVELLERFATRPALRRLTRYIPEVLESFLWEREGRRLRVTVFEAVPDLISLRELMALFPEGMPAPDAAWIIRRLIGQAAAASLAGLAHGALTPDHLLVGITNHEPWHIGWAQAVEQPGRMTQVLDRWRPYIPPEVFERRPFDVRSDIYMAGKTAIALLGGDITRDALPAAVPAEMASALRRCVAQDPQRRYESGKAALDALTQVSRRLWGKVYRPLALPHSA